MRLLNRLLWGDGGGRWVIHDLCLSAHYAGAVITRTSMCFHLPNFSQESPCIQTLLQHLCQTLRVCFGVQTDPLQLENISQFHIWWVLVPLGVGGRCEPKADSVNPVEGDQSHRSSPFFESLLEASEGGEASSPHPASITSRALVRFACFQSHRNRCVFCTGSRLNYLYPLNIWPLRRPKTLCFWQRGGGNNTSLWRRLHKDTQAFKKFSRTNSCINLLKRCSKDLEMNEWFLIPQENPPNGRSDLSGQPVIPRLRIPMMTGQVFHHSTATQESRQVKSTRPFDIGLIKPLWDAINQLSPRRECQKTLRGPLPIGRPTDLVYPSK